MTVYVVVEEVSWDSPTPPERAYPSLAEAIVYWEEQGSKGLQEIWACDETGCHVVWPRKTNS